jgi:isoleucyl-tRNA synthetase
MGQRAELGYPADLYLEGSDQHRGWFQSSLKTAVAMNGSAPYRQVLTHGFFVDADGRKMSKSLGNTVAPKKIYQEYGADILRLWVAATDYRGEMTVSDEIFKRVADAYRRIRNTARFMLSNLNGFDPATDRVSQSEMLALDSWIMRRCQQLQRQVEDHYAAYNFLNVYQKVHNFCVIELGGFYLDVVKDRQYTCQQDSLARRSTQSAMYYLVETLSKVIAPILSFTADEIWQHIPGEREESVFLSDFASGQQELPEHGQFPDSYWQQMMEIKSAVNKELEHKRAEKVVGSGLSADVTLYCDEALGEQLSRLGAELRFVLIVSAAEIRPLSEAGPDAVETEIAGLRLTIQPSSFAKCERCWHHNETVGQSSAHAVLCARCIENVEGSGEVRRFA